MRLNLTMEFKPFYKCNKLGQRDKCGKGLRCNMVSSIGQIPVTPAQPLCTCDIDSTSKPCVFPTQATACSSVKCPTGLACDGSACVCVKNSTHPLCQCDGTLVLEELGTRPVECTRGPQGFCVASSDPSVTCSLTIAMVAAPGFNSCPPGLNINALNQCVCVPLSTNAQCLIKPPSNANASNVCAILQTGCRHPYPVDYAVYQGTTLVTSGTSTVQPEKNYIIITEGIVADNVYALCVRPTNMTEWDAANGPCLDDPPQQNSCCITTSASFGPGNFTNGCADMDIVYSAIDGDC